MSERLDRIFAAIDAANAADPTFIEIDGEQWPAEQLYGERMSAWLDRFAPEAGELVKIAVRAQHLERFKLPRSDFPMDRAGYHRWRNEQKRRHAMRVAELMREAGYSDAEAERVGAIVRKERLRVDPEAQLLEDVACLVFLTHYFASFAAQREEDKLVAIIAKTWRKMSPAAREEALRLPLPEHLAPLVADGVAMAEREGV